ncbi:hypothetical protein ACJ41O_011980 [Fusarium nematophilum]
MTDMAPPDEEDRGDAQSQQTSSLTRPATANQTGRIDQTGYSGSYNVSVGDGPQHNGHNVQYVTYNVYVERASPPAPVQPGPCVQCPYHSPQLRKALYYTILGCFCASGDSGSLTMLCLTKQQPWC